MDGVFGELLAPVFEAIDGFLSMPIVRFGLQLIGLYIVLVWLATAYWAFRDASHRSKNLLAPYFAASLILLGTPLLFIFTAMLWKIIRPDEQSDVVSERDLAQAVLAEELAKHERCGTCRAPVETEWIICPTCRARLKRVCPNCSRIVGLDWSLCAWCGRDFERARGLVLDSPSASLPSPQTPLRPGLIGETAALEPIGGAPVEASSTPA